MKAPRRPAVAVVAFLSLGLASCGSGTPTALPSTVTTTVTTASPTTSGTSTTSGTASTNGSAASCAFPGDTVMSVSDAVSLEAAGEARSHNLPPTAPTTLGCGTVFAAGGGTANVKFPNLAACQFTQDPASTKTAVMRTREPDGTLLRIDTGQVVCTTKNSAQRLKLCGLGDIQPDGAVNQIMAVCNPDPIFQVTVFGGSAKVRVGSGPTTEVKSDQQFEFDPTSPFAGPPISDAPTPTPAQTKLLQLQGRQLGVSFTPPTTSTSTSTSTTSTTAPIR